MDKESTGYPHAFIDHFNAHYNFISFWDDDMTLLSASSAFANAFLPQKNSTPKQLLLKDVLGGELLKHISNNAGLLPRRECFELTLPGTGDTQRQYIVTYIPYAGNNNTATGFYIQLTEMPGLNTSPHYEIIDHTHDAIISKDMNGYIQTWNMGASLILGYSREEAVGQHISLIIPPGHDDEEKALMAQVLANGWVQQYETTRIKKNGEPVIVSSTLSAIKNERGDVIAISNIMRDVTQQTTDIDQMRQSHELNRIFIEQAPNAIAMFDTEMRYIAASEKWLIDYQLEGRNIIGISHYEVFPEIGDDWKKIHQECLKGAINKSDESPFFRQDGTIQWLTWDVRPWYASKDKIGGLIMYTADITQNKLRDAEKLNTQHILEKSNQIARIATWEINGITGNATWSPVANEIFELPKDFIPEKEAVFALYQKGPALDRLLAAVKDSIEHGIPYDLEAEICTARGNKWIRIIGEAEFSNDRCVRRFGIFQDITERKNTEAALNTVNKNLEAILNSGHVSIIGTDLVGNITHFNHGAEVLLGYTADEMVGRQSPAVIHLQTEIEQRSMELTELYGKPVQGFDVFVETARRGEYESREWTYIRKDGTLFPVQLVVTAIKDEAGEIYGFLGVATDISDLKNAENETKTLLEITIDQNQRLKNFAHIVSHNLRSHSGNIDLLLSLYSETLQEPNEYISLIKKASENLKETIVHLNDVALINTSTANKLVKIELAPRIEAATLNVVQLARDAGVNVVNKVPAGLHILGIPAYVDSILLNFITNAIKYRAKTREPHVWLSTEEENGCIILTIEDNGLGIDLVKNRGKLFGMYKTFHSHEDSRGIGLFITKNQIEALSGKVEVESQPDIGTKFKIYFKHAKD